MNTKKSEILQLSTIQNLFGNDLDTIQDVVRVFLKELPLKLELLKKNLEIKDRQGISEVAHMIKGMTRQMGANLMADLAMDMEKNAASLPFEQLQSLLDDLFSLKSQVEQAFYKAGWWNSKNY